MPTTVWINDVDLETAIPGLGITAVPDILHRTTFSLEGDTVLGRAGVVESPSALVVGPRRITISGEVLNDSLTATGVRDLLRTVHRICGPGLVTIRTSDRPALEFEARLHAVSASAYQPQAISTALHFTLEFLAPQPYGQARWPSLYVLDTVSREVGGGDAPMTPTIRLFGAATTITLTYMTAGGVVVRTSVFGVTLAAADWLEVDVASGRITLSTAGTLTEAPGALTAGQFPTAIDPSSHGDPWTGHRPRMVLSAVSGSPTGLVLGREQFL